MPKQQAEELLGRIRTIYAFFDRCCPGQIIIGQNISPDVRGAAEVSPQVFARLPVISRVIDCRHKGPLTADAFEKVMAACSA